MSKRDVDIPRDRKRFCDHRKNIQTILKSLYQGNLIASQGFATGKSM